MSGTAAVIVPVDLITLRGKDYTFKQRKDAFSGNMKKMILGI